MRVLDLVIDVLTRDELDVSGARSALAVHPGVEVFAVPGSDEVSHAELALSPPIPLAMLTEAYGEPSHPPPLPTGPMLAYDVPQDPERRFSAVLLVDYAAEEAVSAKVRRDER